MTCPLCINYDGPWSNYGRLGAHLVAPLIVQSSTGTCLSKRMLGGMGRRIIEHPRSIRVAADIDH